MHTLFNEFNFIFMGSNDATETNLLFFLFHLNIPFLLYCMKFYGIKI